MANFNINDLTGGLYTTFAAKSAKELVSRVKSGEDRVDEIFGTPLFMPLKLDEVQMPLEPVLTIRSRKKIIKTNVNRSKARGTIKELYAEGDYEISINGILMENPNTGQALSRESNLGDISNTSSYSLIGKNFPENAFTKLKAICEKQQAIKIESTITSLLNIEYIVIEDYNFPGQSGKPDRQAYTIRALSDQGSSTENIYSKIIKQLKSQ
ncbi:DUF6046 domain-containing protein [Flammeovirga sp. OC4]|uniref:DUF6046 domain-containing protein n=1 Tax=Flammeovirga sp. OC4 TaxID=1382345 RepID=UPI0005C73D19|nr:DUF6046 domain-containing protein [Flammeovirga sp. OC4]